MGIWIFPLVLTVTNKSSMHVCKQVSVWTFVCFQLSLASIWEWNSRMVVLCSAFFFSTSNVYLFHLQHNLQSMVWLVFFFFFFKFEVNYFTTLYWFWHRSTWIHDRYTCVLNCSHFNAYSSISQHVFDMNLNNSWCSRCFHGFIVHLCIVFYELSIKYCLSCFLKFFIYLFYFSLCWVWIAAWGFL